jgi:hypothetical protein
MAALIGPPPVAPIAAPEPAPIKALSFAVTALQYHSAANALRRLESSFNSVAAIMRARRIVESLECRAIKIDAIGAQYDDLA